MHGGAARPPWLLHLYRVVNGKPACGTNPGIGVLMALGGGTGGEFAQLTQRFFLE